MILLVECRECTLIYMVSIETGDEYQLHTECPRCEHVEKYMIKVTEL